MKIGVMFGNPETTTGGNALKFYAIAAPGHPAHRRDQERRDGGRQPDPREGGEEQDGAALPGGRVRHHVRHGHLTEGDLIDLASESSIVEKSGAWYAFEGERIGQGRENAKDHLREHPEIAASVERRVLEKCRVLEALASRRPSPTSRATRNGPGSRR